MTRSPTLSRSPSRPGTYADQPVSVRAKLSALWTSMLFVFAYVDIFSLYREDVRSDIAAGELGGFEIGQAFLLFVTLYIAIPSLMVILSLVLAPTLLRTLSIVLSSLYGLTIVGGAIGEWNYYILGSAIEVVLLALIGFYAWTWPRQTASPPSNS